MMRSNCLRRLPAKSLPMLRLASTRAFTLRAQQQWSLSRQPVFRSHAFDTHKALFSTSPCYSYAEVIVKVPSMAESISEGTLKQFNKSVGDYVERDEELATIETDKIDVSVNAPEAGTIKEFLANEEDTVTVGHDLIRLETGGAAGESKEKSATSEPKDAASSDQSTSSQPSGEKEESKSDATKSPSKEQPSVQSETSKKEESSPAEPKLAPPESKQPSKKADTPKPKQPEPKVSEGGVGGRGEHRVKMNRMRLRIAERLKQSQNTAASLTTFNKVDMSALMEMRKLYKDDILKKNGIKFGFMGAFTKACVLAMKDIPAVNAAIEGPDGGDTVVYRDFVDVSVAVSTEKGLVTPVIRNAESLDIMDIEKAIADAGKKARDGKLTIEDMAGGTFTISNGGVFGSLVGTPIINLPQTAVLGLHAINKEFIEVNGEMQARPVMWLALTYDHRLLDGREAVTFLVKVKQFIEDPRRMLLG